MSNKLKLDFKVNPTGSFLVSWGTSVFIFQISVPFEEWDAVYESKENKKLNKESGIILQEIQKGFMMKDRLLRPSLVGVSKKIEKKDQNSSENKENDSEKK